MYQIQNKYSQKSWFIASMILFVGLQGSLQCSVVDKAEMQRIQVLKSVLGELEISPKDWLHWPNENIELIVQTFNHQSEQYPLWESLSELNRNPVVRKFKRIALANEKYFTQLLAREKRPKEESKITFDQICMVARRIASKPE